MSFIQVSSREELLKQLKKRLESKRYIHSVSVSYTSAALAMVHGADVNAALLAGLLHDYAKNIPINQQINYCDQHNIHLSDYEMENKCVIHGKVGAFMVMEQLNIKDEEIISAIFNHVMGRENMSLLEKIVFVADYIEPERKPLPNIEEIRKTAFNNIDKSIAMIYENIIEHIESQGRKIDDTTKKIYNFYKRSINE